MLRGVWSQGRPGPVCRVLPGLLLQPEMSEVPLENSQERLQALQGGPCGREGAGTAGYQNYRAGRDHYEKEADVGQTTQLSQFVGTILQAGQDHPGGDPGASPRQQGGQPGEEDKPNIPGKRLRYCGQFWVCSLSNNTKVFTKLVLTFDNFTNDQNESLLLSQRGVELHREISHNKRGPSFENYRKG